MPGSGANLLWDETSPADTANAGAGAGNIRSLETSLRNGLAVEHNWPSSTGANFGVHLPGSARAFYDVQSNVSSTGSDGRLMVASDSSRFFHVGSGGTMFLGSVRNIEFFSSDYGGISTTDINMMHSGVTFTNAQGLAIATFAYPYTGTPFAFGATAYDPLRLCIASVGTVTKSGLSINVTNASGVALSGVSVAWWSVATRALAGSF